MDGQTQINITKIIIVQVFTMISLFCNAQVVKYHYDKEMIFLSEAENEAGITVKFNSKDQSVRVFSIAFNSEKKSIRNTVDFYYLYRKNIYRMDGLLYNKKYVSANGFQTYSAASPIRYFKKASDTLYEYQAYKNLEKRIAEDKDGTRIELFVANLKDGIDYSEPALFYLSEHYGISPGLGKGEVVVYANYIFNKNNSAADYVQLKDISEDIFFNNEQIEALIDDRYNAFVDKWDAEKKPIYCSVTAFSRNVDEKTEEELQSFLSTMCEYFDLSHHQETNENFRQYYDSELERRAAIYRKNGDLNDKQLKVFVDELQQLKDKNSEQYFDYH